MSNLINLIKEGSPLAYQEFSEFLKLNFGKTIQSIPGGFESLEFAFQLGVFLEFFNHQTMDFELDLINYNPAGVEESIRVAFEDFEKFIGHYS